MLPCSTPFCTSANKALYLSLQTQLAWEKIIMNMQGIRDDQVTMDYTRTVKRNPKEGFKQIFGDQSCYNVLKLCI